MLPNPLLDLLGEFLALMAQGGELGAKSWQHKAYSLRAGHHHRLFRKRPVDFGGQSLGEPRRELVEEGQKPPLAHSRQRRRRRIFLQQGAYRGVIELRPQHALQGWMDLCQQPADAVSLR